MNPNQCPAQRALYLRPAVRYEDVVKMVQAFSELYPDYYSYSDLGNNLVGYDEGSQVRPHYVFRNREESFNKANAVLVINYHCEGY